MEYFLYVFLFISLYFQIFLLISYFEKKKPDENKQLNDIAYLTATVIVPCFNEETTVERTIKSLLALEYPEDKLTIMIIDDGSTDNTWQVIQQFANDHESSFFKKKTKVQSLRHSTLH
jgi:cellulose synthase/poly-beta-1,6-N-acetylglucosamine synthase-like glycosyltransferase